MSLSEVVEIPLTCRGYILLMRIHDHIWSCKDIPLAERVTSCNMIETLSIRVLRQESCDVG